MAREWLEESGKRRRCSKTKRLHVDGQPTNKFSLDAAIGPMHYKDAQDDFQDIQTDLVPSSQSISGFGDVAYEMLENEYELFVRKKVAGVAPLVRYRSKNTDYWVDFMADDLDWVNGVGDREHIQAPGNPDTVVSGNEAKWPDAYGAGIDLRFVAGMGRMAKWLDIASPLPAPTIGDPSLEFSEILRFHDDLDIYIDGLLWDKNTEVGAATEIEFRSPDGEVQFVFPVAVGYHEGGLDNHIAGQLHLKKQGNKLYVTARFPWSWLETATYPVHLDTTVDKQTAASGDDGNRFTGSTDYVSNWTSLVVGYDDNAVYLHCHMWARWTGVTIEGTIDVAYVECYGVTSTGSPEMKVYGVDEDNPAAPVDDTSFDADPLTTAAVDWDVSFVFNTWMESPPLISIFQELVNSYTIANDAVMVQIKNDHGVTGGEETNSGRAYDYSGNALGPKLHIEYSAPVVITPTAVSSVAAAVIGAIILGSIAITPTPAASVASKVDPTVVLGSVTIAPAPASAVATGVDPTVIPEIIVPDPASAVGAKVDPTVLFGSTTTTPDPSTAVAAKVDPTVVLGGVVVSPSPVVAIGARVNPTIVLGATVASPSPSTVVVVSISPTVIGGPVSFSPSPSTVVVATLLKAYFAPILTLRANERIYTFRALEKEYTFRAIERG